MVDKDVTEAVAKSFLGKLPPDVLSTVISEGERTDYPAGAVLYRESGPPKAVVVITGLVRVYMSSPEGR